MALRRWCPSGGRAAAVPQGVGPPAKRTSRGDGSVSYGWRSEPRRGKPRDQARGRRVVLRHGAWWRRRRTKVRADDEISGRTRSPRSGQSASTQTLDGVPRDDAKPTSVGVSEAVAGCVRRGLQGPLRWRVTIAPSRFSRCDEALEVLGASRDRSATLAACPAEAGGATATPGARKVSSAARGGVKRNCCG